MDNFNQEQNNMHTNPQNNNIAVDHPKFVYTLVFSILMLLCCNQIGGIIALIFSIMGNSEWKSGRFEESEKNFKYARIALIAGILLTIAIIIFYGIFYGIAFIAAIME